MSLLFTASIANDYIVFTIVTYVFPTIKYVILYLFTDGIFVTQALFGGILRGCGKQFHVAVINVCSYYLLGLPIALTLVYAADMGALGFWIGCTIATYIQVQSTV